MEETDYELKDGHLKIKDGVKSIEKCSFANAKLTSIEIPDSVSSIESKAFLFNSLTNIEIPSSVEYIGDFAFSSNNLTNLKLPNSVKTIGNGAFMKSNLTSVEIPDSVEYIGSSAFRENLLQSIEIPGNIKNVESFSFFKNNLTNVKISNGVEEISSYAFFNNNLKSVEIPSSVEYIGDGSFDDNVEIKYKNYIFSSSFIYEFGCDNIIRASKILDMVPNFNFDIIREGILDIIPIDNDSIKGYMNNYKVFDNLCEEYELEYEYDTEEYQDFYKMCYILGLFHTGGSKQQEVIKVIKDMFNIYLIDDIHQMFTDIKLTTYKEKVAKIILSEYKHPKINKIIAKLYNNYEKMSKAIIKGRKEQIGILNHENNISPSIEIKEQLNHLKSLKKEIMIDDIIKYIQENVFEVSEDCGELKEIATTLSSYLNQSEFEEIEKIYRKAKVEQEEVFKNITDKNQEGVHYYWSKGENPINIILGYICDCCAKYRGAGEDIMIQSMINPNIKNLIIYDSMRHIIGKSTGYYNKEEKYIVFNNIEMKKSRNDSKKEALDAILRGIEEQVESMRERGYEVEDIRIGMLRNDLSDEIKNRKIEIEHNHLLKNYRYKGYTGDASDHDKGQAIIKIK